jgi:asparagine synthase (glutamine-hydrolysing)
MQSQSAFPVRTFTVGFDDDAIDESSQARTTARLLGTDHQEIRLPSGSALDLVARLPDVYDEPFADAAQLPAILVCGAARRQVTVALTGDGGDELFHGYQRYLDAERNWGTLGRVPLWGRQMSAPGLRTAARFAGRGKIAQMLRRQASRVPAASSDDYYARLLSFPDAIAVDRASWHRGTAIAWPKIPSALIEPGQRMRYLDQRMGLPEGIHTKLDRASMAVALELRVPMLDPNLLALAWRMPETWLAHGGVGKLLLRRLLGRRLPEVSKRRKQGFDVPIASWLRGPLRPWADDLLSSARLPDEDLIDMAAVRRMLQDHVAGRADFGYALWSVLMFLSWNRRYG